VNIAFRVIANASKSCVVGRDGDCIKVKIKEPPDDFRANIALIKFLAQKLGISKNSIKIISGERARMKYLSIDCLFTVDQIIAKLLLEG
jgi:uncharacterized protein (TIGR00251 family)